MSTASTETASTGLEIAVIGMAGRFPGAKDIASFWQNISAGEESISFFAREDLMAAGIAEALVDHPNYVPARGLLGDVDKFDASFFGYSPKEAAIMDPQQRLFLQTAWQALEDAGYNSKTWPGLIGVHASVGFNTYLVLNLEAQPDFMNAEHGPLAMLGNDKDFLVTRVAYKLNLKGPAITVQSACSSSLVAVHQACQSLLSGESDMELAGGVTIRVPEVNGNLYQEGMIISSDGHCRPFDKDAAGTVAGNGVGVVVLKRLEDALAAGDHVYAVIKASAINNDGDDKVGYTAPSALGQARAIAGALQLAEVEPTSIGFIETHGSGTSVGDPIELESLRQVYQGEAMHCALGGVKANIGHLDAAAGVAGFIKAVLCVHHKVIPPMVNFRAPNPLCELDGSGFYVPTQASDWNTPLRRAGVSSFGMGGTNVHVILEQAPPQRTSSSSRSWQLIPLSAKTTNALDRKKDGLRQDLQQLGERSLADLAYTLQVGRQVFSHQFFQLAQAPIAALEALNAGHSNHCYNDTWDGQLRPVTFMFSGQGSQYPQMALALYHSEPSFRADIDNCDQLLYPHLGRNLSELMFAEVQGDESPLNRTEFTQPALFVMEYALAQLLMRWGIKPESFIGHSIGEYVAACLAGVFTLEEALRLVAARGRLMQSLPAGQMLFVAASEAKVSPLIRDLVDIALINSPEALVLSGTAEAIAQASERLAEQGLQGKVLRTSHAFHSRMMEPILGEFRELLSGIHLRAPQLPVISNTSGGWLSVEQATSPDYWVNHLRQRVEFAKGIETLTQGPYRIFLEVGPGNSLAQFARQTLKQKEHKVLTSLGRAGEYPDASYALLRCLGLLWQQGQTPDWSAFYQDETRNRLSLSPYPFKGESYWLKMDNRPVATDTPYYRRAWQLAPNLGSAQADWVVAQSGGDFNFSQWQALGQAIATRNTQLQTTSPPTPQEQVGQENPATLMLCYPRVSGFWRKQQRRCAEAEAFRQFLGQWLEQLSTLESPLRIILVGDRALTLTGEPLAEQAQDIHLALTMLRQVQAALPQVQVAYLDGAALSSDSSGRSGNPLGQYPQGIWQAPFSQYLYHQGQWWEYGFIPLVTPAALAQPTSAQAVALIGGSEATAASLVKQLALAGIEVHYWLSATEEPADTLKSLGVSVLAKAQNRPQRAHALAHVLSPSMGIINLVEAEPEGELYWDPHQNASVQSELQAWLTDIQSKPHAFSWWLVEQRLLTGKALGASATAWSAALSNLAAQVVQSNQITQPMRTLIALPMEQLDQVPISGWSSILDYGRHNPHSLWVSEVHPQTLLHRAPELQVQAEEEGSTQGSAYQRPDLPTPYAAPVTSRQKHICAIWQQLFQIDKVGIHDNFFDLGGDSVMALKLLSELEATFSVSLPLAEVINAPCIADQATSIAEYLARGMDERPVNPLVKLNTKGSQPPIFCVHPAGGIIHCYIEMARLLGKDQPFYAFQHPGIDGKIGDYNSFENMAKLYIESMKSVQPQGPYFLGGWSFGGTIAYEMAVQLKAAGEEVAMLAIFDSPGPSALYKLNQRPEFEFAGMLSFLSQALEAMFEAKISVDVEEMRKIPPQEQMDFIMQRVIESTGNSDLGNAREALERIVDLFELCDRGEREYEPLALDIDNVFMYRVQELADYEFTGYKNHPHLHAASFGWDKLCKQPMHIRFIPGTHMTMVFQPYVSSLVEKFVEDVAICRAKHQEALDSVCVL